MELHSLTHYQLDKYLGRKYEGNAACFMFVRDVLIEAGLYVPEFVVSDSNAERAYLLRNHIHDYASKVDGHIQLQRLDIILIKFFGIPRHIGIMYNSKEFMHHDTEFGIIRENIGNHRWENRIQGYYRPFISEPV